MQEINPFGIPARSPDYARCGMVSGNISPRTVRRRNDNRVLRFDSDQCFEHVVEVGFVLGVM